ncbi:double-stranded RNA-specific editase 1-like isoform X1 [Drosophila eugracilis]|uniref:double-stranded RNA-specific editase 1-like isoform X1 n=2 Tax=Drosophila eugracilis TaxID=29029 RepID=UPI001BDA4428|nr:double-stranded RNA-specific editase 1-like isoform X1 [Drosophila eugracilis]
MKRARRPNAANNKSFVSGGIYNPNAIDKPLIQQPLQSIDAKKDQDTPVTDHELPATDPVSVAAEPVQKRVPDAAAISAKLPMPIIVKEEPTEVFAEEDGRNEELSIDISVEKGSGIGGKIPFKKIFQKRKKSSERTRDKKQRQNRQLRKSMLPKNALMALNEVRGVTISDFTIDNNPDGGFTAVVTVNSNQYEGKGLSKMSAKNAACEKAWRDFIIAKMTPKPPRLQARKGENEEEAMETNEEDVDGPEDDLPMLNLASFAIYKLFAEWQREGYVVPEMHPSVNAAPPARGETAPSVPAMPKEPKKPLVRTELPSGWETMHPATILCIMRPGLIYVDHGASGDKPNVLQHLGIIVDNQEFTANGRSKKIARRSVAVKVCNTLFGTNFTYSDISS